MKSNRFLVLLLIIISILVTQFSPVITVCWAVKANDFSAWKEVEPKVNLFWKEMEETPFAAKKTAWQIIRILKEFIASHPESDHVPEAYYLIGRAYLQVGFIPEAVAHWQIVAKEFPQSPWADEALMQIIMAYDLRGEFKKKKRLFREIIRQYPDTIAAKSAWVGLALDVLKKDNVGVVEREANRLQKADPDIVVKVPLFLQLKARIASIKGRDSEAINYYTRYLNLTNSRQAQAATIFEIGEAYRRLGKDLKARKYYALCARDYHSTSYALFARFRIAQLREREEALLPQRKAGGPSEESSSWLYQKIIERYPSHKITQEVELEYARLKLRHGDLIGALRLFMSFLNANPESPLKENFLSIARTVQQMMLFGPQRPETIKKYLDACLSVLEDGGLAQVKEEFSRTSKKLWKRLVLSLEEQRAYKDAIFESRAFSQYFKNDHDIETFSLGHMQEDLNEFLSRGLSKEEYLQVLDFFYSKQRELEAALQRRHLFSIGIAWSALGCAEEAGLYFGRAYLKEDDTLDDTRLLFNWWKALHVHWKSKDLARFLNLFKMPMEGDIRPEYLLMRSDYLSRIGDWDTSYATSSRGLELAPKGEIKTGLLRMLVISAAHLGLYDVARNSYSELSDSLSKADKIDLFHEWMDAALERGDFSEAFIVMTQLSELFDQKDSKDLLSLKGAITLLRSGNIDDARAILRDISLDTGSIWAKIADGILSNQDFWETTAKGLRP